MARALALAVGGLLAFAAAAVWLLGSWFPGGSLRRRPRVSRTSMTLWRVLALNLLVTVSACTAGGSGEHLATTTPIRSRVVPRAPLSQAACVAEMRGWSFSLSQARPVCASARTFPWFHASITNQSAPATYVRCAFTAWDKNDHQLFFGRLPLSEIAFPAGMHLDPHQTRSIDWFFDGGYFPQTGQPPTDTARYTASCTPWKNPPT